MTFAEFEQTRQNYLKKYRKTKKIALPILLTLFIIAIIFILRPNLNFSNGEISFIQNFMPLLFPTFLFIIAYIIILAVATSKELTIYRKAYKTYFVAQSLAKIFTNISYDHLAAMPKSDITQVITTGDRYHSNDFMTATYKSINFSQADVHTESEYTDSDGDTHYATIFRGRFMIFDFRRNFDFALQIRSRAFPGAVLPKNANHNLKFKHFETESTDFNHDFLVYGQDGVDTFYILDPAFMEKIHDLYHALNCAFAMTFLDGKLYIAVNNGKDAFEAPNPKKPIDEKAEIEKVSKDIKAITDFVDHLNLDKYAAKKKVAQ